MLARRGRAAWRFSPSLGRSTDSFCHSSEATRPSRSNILLEKWRSSSARKELWPNVSVLPALAFRLSLRRLLPVSTTLLGHVACIGEGSYTDRSLKTRWSKKARSLFASTRLALCWRRVRSEKRGSSTAARFSWRPRSTATSPLSGLGRSTRLETAYSGELGGVTSKLQQLLLSRNRD